MKNLTIIVCGLLLSINVFSKEIPYKKVIPIEQLSRYLNDEVKKEVSNSKSVELPALAAYFREQFSSRYFYNWKDFEDKFNAYKDLYPDEESSHLVNAEDHRGKYNDSTNWKLPFNYLNGQAVNAYALRHLARQHKMVDIALEYFYLDKKSDGIEYFTRQMRSLNAALDEQKYETIADGNGVYEAFRCGYRVLNWLQIHAMFLSQPDYTDQDQLTTIATLLQHGAHLYQNNQVFKSGNHQTRGVSALAMIAILLRDFEGTDKWYDKAMSLLQEHMEKEINPDGFQFERSVHYHMSDIDNYFFVYGLIKKSGLPVNEIWTRKLESLFTTLSKIAYPDLTAPVLQDDTDIPWGEKNIISPAITLGYLLFEDTQLAYFADEKVNSFMYWFLPNEQLEKLVGLARQKPSYGSLDFPDTGYYIMREGWDKKNKMMIISAGLDDLKPDHQHGDMLGIQGMFYQNVILPNYQVRYSLNDLEMFKNSFTKNVALVDNELQGKEWTSNQGGSGFGKFKNLPQPKVLCWESNEDFDFFAGSHNGFQNIGVNYNRQVIYLKDDLWIVKDNFSSDKEHAYKQVWQGHYSFENSPKLLRSSFENGAGLDIYQLNDVDLVTDSGRRGKQWSVVEKNGAKEYSFVTILYPFENYNVRIDEEKENPDLGQWKLNNKEISIQGEYEYSLDRDNEIVFVGARELTYGNRHIKLSSPCDIFVKIQKDGMLIYSLDVKAHDVFDATVSDAKGKELLPGSSLVFPL